MQNIILFLFLIIIVTINSENVSDGECQNGVLKEKKCSGNMFCKLPDCACSGTEPKTELSERPQIVYLTFDDAMAKLFDDNYYSELFMPDENGNHKYTNPNGCPIRSTFFAKAGYNDYHVVWTYLIL